MSLLGVSDKTNQFVGIFLTLNEYTGSCLPVYCLSYQCPRQENNQNLFTQVNQLRIQNLCSFNHGLIANVFI